MKVDPLQYVYNSSSAMEPAYGQPGMVSIDSKEIEQNMFCMVKVLLWSVFLLYLYT